MAFKLQRNKVQSFNRSSEDRQPAPESLCSFAEATSLHGARFLSSGNVFRRVIWTMALTGSFGLCMYQVYQTVEAFYSRPFNTKITTKTANDGIDITFPAVTLCNFNFFNQRRYRDHAKRHNLSNEDIELKIKAMEKMLAGSKDVYNNESRQRNPELFFSTYGKLLEKDNYFKHFSHSIKDMLLPSSIFNSCVINGRVCGSKNFTSFTNSGYGQCHTLNSGHDGHRLINATLAGHRNTGLNLLLNIERDSYVDNPLLPFVGLTVLVHDQRTFPFMEQDSFSVQPGLRTVCAIKRKEVCFSYEKAVSLNNVNWVLVWIFYTLDTRKT